MSQTDTENDQNFHNFQALKHFSPKFSTDFDTWKVGKGQRGKIVLSMMPKKDENVSGIHIAKDKFSNTFRYSLFLFKKNASN